MVHDSKRPSHPFYVDEMKVTTIAKSKEIWTSEYKWFESQFHYPGGFCLDERGNLLVADTSNHRIRKMDFDSGIVSTIAGCEPGFANGDALAEAKFHCPSDLVMRGDTIYVSDSSNNAIRTIRDGIVSTLVTGLEWPDHIAFDTNGDILVTDYSNDCIRRVDVNSGSTSTFPASIHHPAGIAVSSCGSVYVSARHGSICYWKDDGWKVLIETRNEIRALTVDPFDQLVFLHVDSVKRVNPRDGKVSLFAGSETRRGGRNGLLREATFDDPSCITMNESCMYISDRRNSRIRKISLLRPWNRGKSNDGFVPNLSSRKSPLVPRIDEEGDTNDDDPVDEEHKRPGDQTTEGYPVCRLSIPNERRDLRMNRSSLDK